MSKRCASRAEKRYLRKEHGFSDSDIRVRGHQILLGRADVRPALEQVRSQPGWQFRRKSLAPMQSIRGSGSERGSARHALRIISQKGVDRVFRLPDLAFQVRNLRIRRIEHLSR